MTVVRVMKPEGEKRFREYIATVRENPSATRPDLSTSPYSVEFGSRIEVDEPVSFNSKLELAGYINEKFKDADIQREIVIGESGMWTWLAYFWFDQLTCDPQTGCQKIREEAKYICTKDYRDYYRHLVAGPYSIYSLYGSRLSKIFLYSPVYEHNDFIEQIASRQFLISNLSLIEVLYCLYWDENMKRPKIGAQSRKKPGNLRRFIKVIQQFELTYHIYSLSAQEIINLLPQEFDEWKM